MINLIHQILKDLFSEALFHNIRQTYILKTINNIKDYKSPLQAISLLKTILLINEHISSDIDTLYNDYNIIDIIIQYIDLINKIIVQ